jgi:hypothetical protein
MGADGVGGDGFQSALVDGGTVGGQEDGCVAIAEWENGGEHVTEVFFYLETAAFVASGEGWGVEDDAVKLLISSFEAGENVHDVVRVEAVRFGGEPVEGEVGFASVEGFAR